MAASRRSAYVGLAGALILLAACISLLIAQAVDSAPPRIEIDHVAPPIDLRDSSGQMVSLAHLRGRIVVLFFGSRHCPYTADYADRVGALARRYSSDNVAFFRVETAIEDSQSTEHVGHQIENLAMQTIDDHDGSLAARYGVRVTPTFFVIGPKGKIRYSGAFDDNRDASRVKVEYCREAIQRLTSGEAIATTSTTAFGCSVAPR